MSLTTDKKDGKSGVIKAGKQFAKGSSSNPPAKRTHSDVSPNRSMEEITSLTHQLDEVSEDVKSIRNDLKAIMKKEELETFIKESIAKALSDRNEQIDLMIDIKLEEKLESYNETVKEIEEENKQLKSDIIKLKKEIKTMKELSQETETRSKNALAKSNYNEQYSRKNNVKIMDIAEDNNETEAGLRQQVCGLLAANGTSLDPANILAIHRIPGRQGNTRPVLMKLANNSEKSKVMRLRKQFKDDGKRLVDDVTRLNTELIKRLLDHKSIEQAWYFNGSVFGKMTDGQRRKFDIFDNIESLIRS